MKLGTWVVSALALRALTACFSPTTPSGAPCETTTNMCPSGQTCVAVSGTQGTCSLSGHGPDGGATGDGGSRFCLGAKLAGNVCVDAAPTNAVTLSASISTESVATGNCTEIHVQGAVKYCLITGDTITVPTGTTVHAIGANPLVLMAAHTITVDGTIDVSSHTNEQLAGVDVTGAGGRKGSDCVAVGADGTQGSGSNGSGGGAGGSFGTLGAAGGTGRNNTASGKPAAVAVPTTLLGGCPGGAGGNGAGLYMNMAIGSGAGGFGGGVVYLLAGSSISIAASGTINASGGGGLAGYAGGASSGGGGGGGAGGLIGIESPSTTISGILFANGGGGGGGGGADENNLANDTGMNGSTPTALSTAAAGGMGALGVGGGGGTGSTATAPKVGGNAQSGGDGPYAGGGGGGGGLGFIKAYGTPTTTGAMFSPPMTSN